MSLTVARDKRVRADDGWIQIRGDFTVPPDGENIYIFEFKH